MNSAQKPQLLKLEEAFDETVTSGTTIQEELKCFSFEMSRWTQIILELENWRHCSILNFEGTSVCNGIGTIDRVRGAKGKGKKCKNDHQKGKGKDAKGKGKKGKGDQKGKEGDHKGNSKGKDQKGKGVATCYTCEKPEYLSKDWKNHIRQVASGQIDSEWRLCRERNTKYTNYSQL